MGKALFALLALLLTGCTHSTIVPFPPSSGPAKLYPPTDPKTVGVFRVENPFASFEELGLIHFQTSIFDLQNMYQQIRKDAAAYGAEAVIDVRLDGETHTEYVNENICFPVTACGAEGCTTEDVCHLEPRPETVSTFTITGSMIRKKP